VSSVAACAKQRPLQSPPIQSTSESIIGTTRRICFDVTMAPVTRFATFLLLIALAASPLLAQTAKDGSADPVFSQIPFEQWLSQGDSSHIHWTVRLSEPELSIHQRFITEVSVQVDGAELARRRGQGQFLVLVQVNDEKGRVWQNHQELDLEHMEEGIKTNNAVFSQLFFVLPGDYRVSIVTFANATGDHSATQRKLHVSPLKNDPLPGAWRDLPAVEFLPPAMLPDSWYLPTVEGKLRLAVETHEPVHVDLVVNLTPSEQLTGSTRAQNRNLGVLLPVTKVLSQVDWGSSMFSLALLDLLRHRVTYEQENSGGLDWYKASGSLSEVNPGIIDVKSLEQRQFSAQFFLDEIRRRIGAAQGSAPGRPRVMIVLSSLVRFASGQELHPIALDGPSDARVYYIRYRPAPQMTVGRPADTVQRRGRLPGGDLRTDFVAQFDQLEPLLKPLEPRLFDVATPEQFRKALAVILGEIAKL
jgi:hypothetical protein